MVTNEKVLSVLHECFDPEIPIDVVNLGLIYGISIYERLVSVRMTLTNRWCPASSWIEQNVRTRLLEIPDVVDAKVQIVWEPKWTPEMMTPEALQSIQWLSAVEKRTDVLR